MPFLLVDRSAWDDKRNIFRLHQNPDFLRQIQAELSTGAGLGRDAEIITMCRSGSERGRTQRRLPARQRLPNARFVIDGFQGPASRTAPGRAAPPGRLAEQWPAVEQQDEPREIHRTDRRPEHTPPGWPNVGQAASSGPWHRATPPHHQGVIPAPGRTQCGPPSGRRSASQRETGPGG